MTAGLSARSQALLVASTIPGHRAKVRSSAPIFIDQLTMLARLTGDLRFVSALAAVYDNGLTHNKAWRRNVPHHLFSACYKEWDDWAFVIVENCVAEGQSRRIACAVAAADLAVPGNSFDAAVKHVERIWKSYKSQGKTVGEVIKTISAAERMQKAFEVELQVRAQINLATVGQKPPKRMSKPA